MNRKNNFQTLEFQKTKSKEELLKKLLTKIPEENPSILKKVLDIFSRYFRRIPTNIFWTNPCKNFWWIVQNIPTEIAEILEGIRGRISEEHPGEISGEIPRATLGEIPRILGVICENNWRNLLKMLGGFLESIHRCMYVKVFLKEF